MADTSVKVNVLADATQADAEVNKLAATTERGATKIEASASKSSAAVKGMGSQISQSAAAIGGPVGVAGSQVGSLVTKFEGLGAAKGIAIGVGVGVLAIGAALYQVGSEFDNAYDHLQIFTGEGGTKLDALREQFNKIYADLPSSSGDVAAVLSLVTSRLDESGSSAGGLSEEILNLTRLMGGDVVSNTNAAIDVFQRWGVSADQRVATLDMFAAASQASGVAVSDLLQQVANGAAGFQEFGYSLEQSVAMLAAIGKTGGDADKITTGLSKGIVNIGKLQDQAAANVTKNAASSAQAADQERTRLEGIAKANQTLVDKQLKLTQAQAEYRRVMTTGVELAVSSGRVELARATVAVDDAQLGVIDSKRKLDALLKGPTEQDVAEARQKVAEATAQITTAMIAQAEAQNALADAETQGVSGTDLARKKDAVTKANLDLSKAQVDASGAAGDLNDLLNWQQTHAPDIADATQAVADAQQRVADANQSRADTEDKLKRSLGPNLDGQQMLWDAAVKVGEAQRNVSDALIAQRDAQRKQTSASAASAVQADETGGSYKRASAVLKTLGLEHASAADQVQGLIHWMGTSSDTIATTGVAAELFGARSAPAMVKALHDSQAALGGIDDSMSGSKGKISALAKATDDSAEAMQRSWNRLKGAIQPLASAVFNGVSFVANYFSDAIAHWGDNWDGFWQRFHDGWSRIVGFVAGIPGMIGGAASHMWDGITNAFNGMIMWIFDRWNKFADSLGFNLPSIIGGGHVQLIPHITPPKFHGGGTVPGPVGQEMLAIVQGGEKFSTPTGYGGDSGSDGGTHYHFHNHGVIGSRGEAEKWILESIASAKRKGMTKLVA